VPAARQTVVATAGDASELRAPSESRSVFRSGAHTGERLHRLRPKDTGKFNTEHMQISKTVLPHTNQWVAQAAPGPYHATRTNGDYQP
jgi:hypothetical protein